MKKSVLLVLVLALLFLCACDGPGADPQRLEALEAEVAALRQEVKQRDQAFKDELIVVRKNLENIQKLLEVDESRAKIREEAESGIPSADKELDDKAKSFVDENLDRLLELTRKMLDKMEKEFDEHLKGNKETPPQGDEI
ncbi:MULTISPECIES: hypothetical protein [unclassified Pseudodesulfovibrio]|uniref:hypothetical protein n=1 Tax=unclassified Pseudodesulfovibrio TaxID=2661612 RepID=UPI000FEB8E51|nr:MULTISPECIES: hypothetical protein [unclassified Pseudodesulfovibrio]MCJ2165691.1 hypothetical protein [Pseudodesulfovibrio sp. S3-i]RWU02954.1 hypothetical protein DWB63_13710 [Pseudodesulfovibrio sp. S3]